MTNFRLILSAAALVALAAGCSPRSRSGDNSIAIVGTYEINSALFLAQITNAVPPLTDAQKDAVLQDLIRTEVLVQKAMSTRFDRRPEVILKLKRLLAASFEEELRRSPTNMPGLVPPGSPEYEAKLRAGLGVHINDQLVAKIKEDTRQPARPVSK